MLKLMRTKVKKPYDGPPRPNLMSHDKVIRDQKKVVDSMSERIGFLERRLEQTESRLLRQTEYLSHLHNNVVRLKK